jgi:hypothetical protein
MYSDIVGKLPLVGNPTKLDLATAGSVLIAAAVSRPGFGGRALNVLNFSGVRALDGTRLEQGMHLGIKSIPYSETVIHALLAVVIFWLSQKLLMRVEYPDVGMPSGLLSGGAAPVVAPPAPAPSEEKASEDAGVAAMRKRRAAVVRARAAQVAAQRRSRGLFRGLSPK